MLISSRELYQFYKDYLEWIESGAFDHGIFTRYDGLCCNLCDYCTTLGLPVGKLSVEMTQQFGSAGLNELLPFNKNADLPYRSEVRLGICHKNGNRVQWVRDRIEDVKWLCEPIKAPLGKVWADHVLRGQE